MYTWGIFLAYKRRRLSSRLRFHVFWEAGRDIHENKANLGATCGAPKEASTEASEAAESVVR